MANDQRNHHEVPRTFREVGIMMAEIRDDIDAIQRTQEKMIARMDRFVSVLIVSLLCPIIVAVVVGYVIKSAK